MSMFPSSEAAWLSCFWFISHLFIAHSASHVSPLWFFQVWFNKPYAMHCVKRVRIRNYSGPHFPHSDWIRRDSVSLSIQPKCGKMRTTITPNTDTFYAVNVKLWIPGLSTLGIIYRRSRAFHFWHIFFDAHHAGASF